MKFKSFLKETVFGYFVDKTLQLFLGNSYEPYSLSIGLVISFFARVVHDAEKEFNEYTDAKTNFRYEINKRKDGLYEARKQEFKIEEPTIIRNARPELMFPDYWNNFSNRHQYSMLSTVEQERKEQERKEQEREEYYKREIANRGIRKTRQGVKFCVMMFVTLFIAPWLSFAINSGNILVVLFLIGMMYISFRGISDSVDKIFPLSKG